MILSPSDASVHDGERAVIAGRVIDVDAAGAVVADDVATIVAELAPGTCAPFDLVEIEGELRGGRLVHARLLSRASPAAGAHEDVRRLLFGGGGRRLRARARALDVIRSLFRSEGFLEVDTPALVPSPGLDIHLDAVAADGGYLATSPEYQMKRLLAGGIPRCFQLARCYRKGERGNRHNPEFTMLEWYRSFAGYEEVMADTERVVCAVAHAENGAPSLAVDGRVLSAEPPFLRVTVAEAFAAHAGVSEDAMLELADHDEDQFFRLMVERVEPALAALSAPVFLVDYPVTQASLARRKPSDGRYAERFELYAGGVELCNGFGELTDPAEQRSRFEADQRARATKGLPVYPLDERFLAALESGLPRCAGNALGVDRLVALVLGADRIGDVQAFSADVL